MKLFETLNKELQQQPAGEFAPFYYRVLGYQKDLAARPAPLRAEGIYTLFTETKPQVLKSEIIAGNMKSSFADVSQLEMDYAGCRKI